MTLRLLHRPNSRSARVRWLLEEIGVPYELVPVSDEEKASEEYRSRHPLGRVPVLETDEGIVFETLAVCVHLAEQYPEASLLPAPGSFDRALVFQWISLGLTEVEPHLGEMRRAEESAPELAEAARGRAFPAPETHSAAGIGALVEVTRRNVSAGSGTRNGRAGRSGGRPYGSVSTRASSSSCRRRPSSVPRPG